MSTYDSLMARCRCAAIAMALASLTFLSCDDGSGTSSATFPAGGVFEATLVENPTVELDLTHTALLSLEAVGGSQRRHRHDGWSR